MPTVLNPVTADRVKAVCPNADGDIIEAIMTGAPRALPAARAMIRPGFLSSSRRSRLKPVGFVVWTITSSIRPSNGSRISSVQSSKQTTTLKATFATQKSLRTSFMPEETATRNQMAGGNIAGAALFKSLAGHFEKVGKLVGL